MATAADIISGALRLIMALESGEVMTSAEGADGLEALNMLLDSWSTSSLLIPCVTQTQYPTTGQIIALPTRPMRVVDSIASLNGIDYPVAVISLEAYQAIPLKTLSARPNSMWWDQQYPSSNLYLYPVPDQIYTLKLATWERLSSIASLNTVVNLPGEYARTIKYNLAIELAPEWGVQTTPEVKAVAADSLKAIKGYNGKAVPLLSSDYVGTVSRTYGGGHFDWRTGL